VTRLLGINGNIMSLGGIAIAIGAMIDAAIVMLENLHKHIEREPDRPHWERVLRGRARGRARAVHVLAELSLFRSCRCSRLEDQEGRLFRPLL